MPTDPAPHDGYTVKAFSHVLGFRLDGDTGTIAPVTWDVHHVKDGDRTVAACASQIEADRIAQLLDVHGLVDVDAEAIP
jgi:hypothetical protein